MTPQESKAKTSKHGITRPNENESNGDIRNKVSSETKSPKFTRNPESSKSHETESRNPESKDRRSSQKRHSGRETERTEGDSKRRSSGSIREKEKREKRRSREYKEKSSRSEQVDALPQVSTRSSNADSHRSKGSPRKNRSSPQKHSNSGKQLNSNQHISNSTQEHSSDLTNHVPGKVEFVWKKPKVSSQDSNGITKRDTSPTGKNHRNSSTKAVKDDHPELEPPISSADLPIAKSTANPVSRL